MRGARLVSAADKKYLISLNIFKDKVKIRTAAETRDHERFEISWGLNTRMCEYRKIQMFSFAEKFAGFAAFTWLKI